MMLDLVLWSFVMALAPLVLGLAWKLVRGFADVVGVGDSQVTNLHDYHTHFDRRRAVSRGHRW